MKLHPVRDYPEQGYPRASDRLVKSVFLAVTMTATTLGGCGPLGNFSSLDASPEMQDLAGTVGTPVADVPAPDTNEAKQLDSDQGEAAGQKIDGK
jgi:hypothetical protein